MGHHLKWECTGTPTIFKCNHPINYVTVDANGRRHCQHNTIIIIKSKKGTERAAAEAEFNVRQMDVFCAFSQESSNPSPPPALQEKAS